jgi:hypothetical protein
MARCEFEELLMDHSFEFYPGQSDQDLKNAIITNLQNGTISPDELPEWK